jgi:hypothetical protein
VWRKGNNGYYLDTYIEDLTSGVMVLRNSMFFASPLDLVGDANVVGDKVFVY